MKEMNETMEEFVRELPNKNRDSCNVCKGYECNESCPMHLDRDYYGYHCAIVMVENIKEELEGRMNKRCPSCGVVLTDENIKHKKSAPLTKNMINLIEVLDKNYMIPMHCSGIDCDDCPFNTGEHGFKGSKCISNIIDRLNDIYMYNTHDICKNCEYILD